jgi:hypothetical protein
VCWVDQSTTVEPRALLSLFRWKRLARGVVEVHACTYHHTIGGCCQPPLVPDISINLTQ